MSFTLFRAYASADPSPAGGHLDDAPVFFEACDIADAHAKLLPMLATLWGCPPDHLDAYNLSSESLLRQEYREEGEPHADAALLGSGYSEGRVTYLDPSRALLYVGPVWHRRLSAALQALDRPHAQAPGARVNATRGA
jgi:hypothetical protein